MSENEFSQPACNPSILPPTALHENSHTFGKLFAALAKAQGEFPAPPKDKTAVIHGKDGKAGYEYKYSDLATVLESNKVIRAKYGIALTSVIKNSTNGLMLVTVLAVEDERIVSHYPLKSTSGRPQELGSEITYGRRYSVSMMLGVASENDDDGAAAEIAATKEKNHGSANRKPPPVQPRADYQKTPEQLASPATLKQKQMIFGMTTKELGYTEDNAGVFFSRVTKKASSKEWVGADIDAILKAIPEEKKILRAAENQSGEAPKGEFHSYEGGPVVTAAVLENPKVEFHEP